MLAIILEMTIFIFQDEVKLWELPGDEHGEAFTIIFINRVLTFRGERGPAIL